ncbi:MAG TPA: DNA polymerase IV [Firmicutes bacterium]|nr:DNA polymerase IV [Bacillota bacterium]
MEKYDRSILHVDMNAFFAAVEQHDNPRLRGKPVIVCGDPEGRSVVSTASYEARPFGIKAGMPVTQAKLLCPEGIFIKGDIQKYVRVSLKIVDIYKSFTPLVEPFSIDEAFLDVTGCDKLFGSPVDIARLIKARIRKELGLTCSIGIGPNKLLSKMASDFQKPDGLVVIKREEIPDKIWILPVRNLIGVGEKTEKALHSLGINTIGDLARYPVEFLECKFGIMGRALHLMALGIDHSPVQPSGLPVKSISHEYTLPRDTANQDILKAHIIRLSGEVGRRLRKGGYVGKTIVLKLRYEDFITITRSETLGDFTDCDKVIYQKAWGIFLRSWQCWRKVRLIGVGISNLIEKERFQRQLSLFDDYAKQAAIDRAVDSIRDRFGGDAIMRAGCWFSRRTCGLANSNDETTPGVSL